MKWETSIPFVSWYTQDQNGSSLPSPLETQVSLAHGTISTSLQTWLQNKLGSTKPTNGSVSHSWGYFSFSFTTRIVEPRQEALAPVQSSLELFLPETRPNLPFCWVNMDQCEPYTD